MYSAGSWNGGGGWQVDQEKGGRWRYGGRYAPEAQVVLDVEYRVATTNPSSKRDHDAEADIDSPLTGEQSPCAARKARARRQSPRN